MSNLQPTILIIDDEPQIRRFLRAALGSQDYRLLEATNAKEGAQEAASCPPDVVLLDLGLPDRDGMEVIQQLRSWTSVPIIVISARGQESDKVAALDLGADDYLTKPFGVPELLARIRVALRNSARTTEGTVETVFVSDELKVDLARREVFLSGHEVKLTPIEFKLLALLVKHAGRVVTQSQILNEVWGPAYGPESQSLRVFVHQLRQKIEPVPGRPKFLMTETGVGYRLKQYEKT
jgi:two-component system KDP operon response regulator KdpE